LWLCGFGCQKKKLWLCFIVDHFEVKKERKNFPAPRVRKQGDSEASPRNYETNIVKKFCDEKKKHDLGGFSSYSSWGFFFSLFFQAIGWDFP
jgi:hypothetical protein